MTLTILNLVKGDLKESHEYKPIRRMKKIMVIVKK